MYKNYFYRNLRRKRMTKEIHFQLGGVPNHFSKLMHIRLNEILKDRCIAQGELISWTSRSLDLTQCDVFV